MKVAPMPGEGCGGRDGETMGNVYIYIDFIYSRNVGVSMLQPDDGFMTLDLQDVGSFTSLK